MVIKTRRRCEYCQQLIVSEELNFCLGCGAPIFEEDEYSPRSIYGGKILQRAVAVWASNSRWNPANLSVSPSASHSPSASLSPSVSPSPSEFIPPEETPYYGNTIEDAYKRELEINRKLSKELSQTRTLYREYLQDHPELTARDKIIGAAYLIVSIASITFSIGVLTGWIRIVIK